jgi:hypothetical protein
LNLKRGERLSANIIGETVMITYILYVHDDRYSIPNMVFAEARDAAHSKELAALELNRSEHHLAVDVRQADAFCYRLTRRGERSQTQFEDGVKSNAPPA